jgi:hypothetical protein
MVDIAGWFKGGHREFAKMALAVLLEFDDPKARAIAEKRANTFWTHGDLKRSYTETLARFVPKLETEAAQ